MPSGFLVKFYPILTLHTAGQITRKIGFSASHWLSWSIRGLEKIQWIPGKILPHFDPSYLSVGQITRKSGISASHWSANKKAKKIIGFLAKFGLSLAISAKIQHDKWIPGKILPHFDPSYLPVG